MKESATILLIDDDIDLCESINKLLSQHGFNVLVRHDSQSIPSALDSHTIDLILLDIILPGGKDGFSLCQFIRKKTTAPIIMLSGIAEDAEKIISLEMGADGYLTKPFNSRVLIAHIHSCLRRHQQTPDCADTETIQKKYQIYEFSGWKMNETAHMVISPANQLVNLTATEYLLLTAFLNSPHCVLSRDQLMNHIDLHSESFDRSIDILISRLRSKLESDSRHPQIIKTIRNAGYMLSCKVAKTVVHSDEWGKKYYYSPIKNYNFIGE